MNNSLWDKIGTILFGVIFWAGCGTMIYFGIKKVNKKHKIISPRYAKAKDTVYFRDSGFVFTKHLDTVFKVVDTVEDSEPPDNY